MMGLKLLVLIKQVHEGRMLVRHIAPAAITRVQVHVIKIGNHREIAGVILIQGHAYLHISVQALVGNVGRPGIVDSGLLSAVLVVQHAAHAEAHLQATGVVVQPAVGQRIHAPARVVEEAVSVMVHVHEIMVRVSQYHRVPLAHLVQLQ